MGRLPPTRRFRKRKPGRDRKMPPAGKGQLRIEQVRSGIGRPGARASHARGARPQAPSGRGGQDRSPVAARHALPGAPPHQGDARQGWGVTMATEKKPAKAAAKRKTSGEEAKPSRRGRESEGASGRRTPAAVARVTLHSLKPAVGSHRDRHPQGPRAGLGARQDRRPRRQGPDGALGRQHAPRVRGRPDAAHPAHPQARLHQSVQADRAGRQRAPARHARRGRRGDRRYAVRGRAGRPAGSCHQAPRHGRRRPGSSW